MTSIDAAEHAIMLAIEQLNDKGIVADRSNVPEKAKRILMGKSRRDLSSQEATRQIRQAVISLVNKGNLNVTSGSNIWSMRSAMTSTTAEVARVFVVHGSNSPAKTEVARFIERLGLKVTILHERPGKGRTLITKFEEEASNVQFVVVIMTADDKGAKKGSKKQNSRARQNVVFELGFFIGKLGSAKVCALMASGVERPSDFDGVEYIPYSRDKKWRAGLVRELEAALVKLDHELLISALQT